MQASEVMTRWFERVWCEQDEAAIDEMLSPTAVVHGLGPAPLTGTEGFKIFWNDMRDSFSNFHIEVEQGIDQGDTGYVRFAGTMEFDGRPVEVRGGCLSRVEDGVIVEAHNEWDALGCLAQMGAVPADVFPRACAGECFGEAPA